MPVNLQDSLYEDEEVMYMPPWIQLLLTIACALAVGYFLDRIRMPGGMMVGAVLGSSLLGVLAGQSYMPGFAKTTAQIIACFYIR